MELAITFRNVDPSEALKERAEKRFQKVLKHLKEPATAHITVTVDKHRHRAELTVHTNGDVLHASTETDDMYVSVDQAIAKIAAAARKQKERHQR